MVDLSVPGDEWVGTLCVDQVRGVSKVTNPDSRDWLANMWEGKLSQTAFVSKRGMRKVALLNALHLHLKP